MQPIKNAATVNIMDLQTLSIQPWDKSIITKIAKAISDENIGLNPQSMGDSVIIRMPPMTEDRRKQSVKFAKDMAEEAKISVRTARQESLKLIDQAKKDKTMSEDALK
jgi:ribosome recycling factor